MSEESRAEDEPSTAVEVVAAAAGTGMGALLGGTVGAMAGAGLQPIIAQALQRAGAEIGLWRRAAAGQVLHEAARRLDRSPDELIDTATHSPESAQLLAETLLAAARTVNEQKIRALARALANGLRDDDARPDEEQLLVAALAEVETSHIKVLTNLGPERTLTRTATTSLRSRSAPAARGRRAGSLAEEANLSLAAVRAVLSVLQRAGMAVADDGSETIRIDRLIIELQEEFNKVADLVVNPPRNGKIPTSKKPRQLKRPGSPAASSWTITPFGQLCLNYLDDVDSEIAPSDALERADDQPSNET